MVGMLLLGGHGVGSPGRWSWPWDISAPPPVGGCPFPVPGWPSVRAALLGAFGPPKDTVHDSSHQKFCFMASLETWEKFCWLIKNRLSPPWAGDSHRGAAGLAWWTLTLSAWGLAHLWVHLPSTPIRTTQGRRGAEASRTWGQPLCSCSVCLIVEQKGKRTLTRPPFAWGLAWSPGTLHHCDEEVLPPFLGGLGRGCL